MNSRLVTLLCALGFSTAAVAAEVPPPNYSLLTAQQIKLEPELARHTRMRFAGAEVTARQISFASNAASMLLQGAVTIRIRADQPMQASAASISFNRDTRISTLRGNAKIALDGGEISSDNLTMKPLSGADAEYVEITGDRIALTRQDRVASP